MMPGFTVYIFHFTEDGDVDRIPYAKWKRIRAGQENSEEYSGQAVHIAYAYLSLENRKPDYCPRIDGAIYYFDESGRVVLDKPCYFDLLQGMEEGAGGVINLQHHRMKRSYSNKHQWKLSSQQIQAVVDNIW